MTQTLIRSSCRSLCALAIALLAACAPSEEGKIPCDDTGNCPSDFPTCSTSKFCVAFSPAVKLVGVSGDSQSAAVAGSALPAPLVVSAQDVNDAGVPGIAVTWTVTAGGGTVTATGTTGADGTASVTPTLGNTVATNTFTAASSGLSGTPTFNELSIAGPTTSFLVSFPASIGVQIPGAATVTAKDKNGNLSNFSGNVAVTLGTPDNLATLPATPLALTITSASPATIPGILFGKAALGQKVIVTDTAAGSTITGTSNPFNVAAGTSTTTVASGQNPSVFGQSVTFTAHVTGSGSGSLLPTGTVTFFSDSVGIGTGTLVGGQATFATAALAVGTHSITAQYGGDAGFAGSTSITPVSQIVNKAGTTVSLASVPNPSVFGQSVTFTATVAITAPGAGTLTGTVAFRDGATNLATCATQALGTTTATCSISTLSAVSHSITAVYNGDASFAASAASNTVTQVVNKAATTIALGATTATVFGQAVTFTATITVTPPGAGAPTGTVTFFNGTAIPANQIACTGAGNVIGGTTATCTTLGALPVSAGLSINATYNGDASFASSTTTTAASQVVNKASTTVGLVSSANPSVSGQTVVFTATVNVTAPGAGTPSGTIKFQDNGVDISGCASVSVAVGTCSLANLGVGTTNSIVAIYSGDGNFNTSTSPAVNQVINKANTTTVVSPATTTSKPFGTSVTFTAAVTVDAPGAGTPGSGDSIKFQNGGVDIAGCTTTIATPTCTTSALPVGTNSITAVYAGNGNLNGSTSTAVTQIIAKAPTAVVVTSDKPAPVFGESVTFTAAITATPAGSVTGSVTFKDGLTAITCTGVGQGTVSSNSATCSTASLSASGSPHSITATYNGDGNFLTFTSPAILQTVNPAVTTVSPVTFAPPGPKVGDTVTLSAQVNVTPPGSGPATGTVTFSDTATPIGGTCTGAAVNSSGIATCTTATLPVGSRSISAAFTNVDGNFLGSATTVSTTIIIKDIPTISAFTFNQGATGTGTFSVTVTGNATNAPTGTVTVSKGATVVTTCALPSPGAPPSGSCTTPTVALSTGSQTFTATYPGDTNYAAAAPNAITPTVTALPPPGTAAVIDGGPASGKVFVVTGNSQATSIYDPATSASTAGPRLSAARSALTATAIGNGQILLAGGNASGGSTFELCTVASCNPVGALSMQRCNAAAALVGSAPARVLVAGGDDCSGSALASWDLWSAGGVTSSAAGNHLGEARASLTATVVADGTVLLAGGGSGELFKLADLSVTKLLPMLAVRSGHTATLLPAGSKACASGSCVFLAGGVSSGPTWEIFDAAANTFGRPANAMELLNPSRARQAAALLADGRVLLAGGQAGNQAIETTEAFDGARLAPGPALQAPRIGAGAAYLPALDLLMLSGNGESPELITLP